MTQSKICIIPIKNLSCISCSSKIESLFQDDPSILSIRTNIFSKQIRIKYIHTLTNQEIIIKHLKKHGFIPGTSSSEDILLILSIVTFIISYNIFNIINDRLRYLIVMILQFILFIGKNNLSEEVDGVIFVSSLVTYIFSVLLFLFDFKNAVVYLKIAVNLFMFISIGKWFKEYIRYRNMKMVERRRESLFGTITEYKRIESDLILDKPLLDNMNYSAFFNRPDNILDTEFPDYCNKAVTNNHQANDYILNSYNPLNTCYSNIKYDGYENNIINDNSLIDNFKGVFNLSPRSNNSDIEEITANDSFKDKYYVDKSLKTENSIEKGVLSQNYNDDFIINHPYCITTVKLHEISVNDHIVIKKGQTIPVDGILLTNYTYTDEHILSGESLPVYKYRSDKLFAGTKLLYTDCICKVTHVRGSTVYSEIIHSYTNSQFYLPNTLLTSFNKFILLYGTIITLFYILLYGLKVRPKLIFDGAYDFFNVLKIFVAIFISSCPCAITLCEPLLFLSASYKLLMKGCVVKDVGRIKSKIDMIVFDKTGTLTDNLEVNNFNHLNNKVADLKSKNDICRIFQADNGTINTQNHRNDKGEDFKAKNDIYRIFEADNGTINTKNHRDDKGGDFKAKNDIYRIFEADNGTINTQNHRNDKGEDFKAESDICRILEADNGTINTQNLINDKVTDLKAENNLGKIFECDNGMISPSNLLNNKLMNSITNGSQFKASVCYRDNIRFRDSKLQDNKIMNGGEIKGIENINNSKDHVQVYKNLNDKTVSIDKIIENKNFQNTLGFITDESDFISNLTIDDIYYFLWCIEEGIEHPIAKAILVFINDRTKSENELLINETPNHKNVSILNINNKKELYKNEENNLIEEKKKNKNCRQEKHISENDNSFELTEINTSRVLKFNEGDEYFSNGDVKVSYTNVSGNYNLKRQSYACDPIDGVHGTLILTATQEFIIPYKIKKHLTTYCLYLNHYPVARFNITEQIDHNAFLLVQTLLNLNYPITILSGDSQLAVEATASSLGICSYLHNQSPLNKLQYIKNQQSKGFNVMMIGDGINDLCALKEATIGINYNSFNNETTVSVLEKDLFCILDILEIGKRIRKRSNICYKVSFIYNLVVLIIASGVFIPFGVYVDPEKSCFSMFASFLMVIIFSTI